MSLPRVAPRALGVPALGVHWDALTHHFISFFSVLWPTEPAKPSVCLVCQWSGEAEVLGGHGCRTSHGQLCKASQS